MKIRQPQNVAVAKMNALSLAIFHRVYSARALEHYLLPHFYAVLQYGFLFIKSLSFGFLFLCPSLLIPSEKSHYFSSYRYT